MNIYRIWFLSTHFYSYIVIQHYSVFWGKFRVVYFFRLFFYTGFCSLPVKSQLWVSVVLPVVVRARYMWTRIARGRPWCAHPARETRWQAGAASLPVYRLHLLYRGERFYVLLKRAIKFSKSFNICKDDGVNENV